MQELLAHSLTYPTVVWTVLLGLVSLYWLLVLFGAVGLESLDASVEGAADAAAQASGEAMGEAIEAIGDSAEAAGDSLSLLSLFGLLRRRKAPVTVKATALALLGWPLTFYASEWLLGTVPPRIPLLAWGTGLLIVSVLICVPLAAAALVPLEPVFDVHEARRRSHLVGEVVEIETSRVDRRFGQARLEDGQAGLILQVRCDPERGLVRGKRALILAYDEQDETYEVEPYDELLRERRGDP